MQLSTPDSVCVDMVSRGRGQQSKAGEPFQKGQLGNGREPGAEATNTLPWCLLEGIIIVDSEVHQALRMNSHQDYRGSLAFFKMPAFP